MHSESGAARYPPSMGTVAPLIMLASSLSKSEIILVTSSTCAKRPNGIFDNMGAALEKSSQASALSSVRTTFRLGLGFGVRAGG